MTTPTSDSRKRVVRTELSSDDEDNPTKRCILRNALPDDDIAYIRDSRLLQEYGALVHRGRVHIYIENDAVSDIYFKDALVDALIRAFGLDFHVRSPFVTHIFVLSEVISIESSSPRQQPHWICKRITVASM